MPKTDTKRAMIKRCRARIVEGTLFDGAEDCLVDSASGEGDAALLSSGMRQLKSSGFGFVVCFGGVSCATLGHESPFEHLSQNSWQLHASTATFPSSQVMVDEVMFGGNMHKSSGLV